MTFIKRCLNLLLETQSHSSRSIGAIQLESDIGRANLVAKILTTRNHLVSYTITMGAAVMSRLFSSSHAPMSDCLNLIQCRPTLRTVLVRVLFDKFRDKIQVGESRRMPWASRLFSKSMKGKILIFLHEVEKIISVISVQV